jgi:hypothetical protein
MGVTGRKELSEVPEELLSIRDYQSHAREKEASVFPLI